MTTLVLVVRRFDSAQLYEAMDTQRHAREMTWRQISETIGVSVSTIKRTREGGRMEVDGMLNMADWVGRSVEDFVVDTEI